MCCIGGDLQKKYKVPAAVRVERVAELYSKPMTTVHDTASLANLLRTNGRDHADLTSTSGSMLGKCAKCELVEEYRHSMSLGSSLVVQATGTFEHSLGNRILHS